MLKRVFIPLFLIGAVVSSIQAQSCEETLAYYVGSTEGEAAELVAQTVCAGAGAVTPLAQSLSEQFVALDAWSSVSNSVAYGFGTIFVVNQTTPIPQVVLEETDTTFYHNPLWSPDGTQLLVIETDEEGMSEGLVLTDLAGNARPIMPLSSNPESEMVIVPVNWSPDGAWISYTLSQPVDELNWDSNIQLLSTACITDPSQTCEAHTLEITDGSGERPALELEDGGSMPEHWWGAVWSPDSTQLAFVCGENLCFINADGTNFRRSDFEFHGHSLAWSPSGRYLAYFAEDDIYVHDIEQESHTNVTQTPDIQEFLPVWIPLPEGAFLFEQP
jgi:dipeptidyl aminopeptidase/acylaminoacyl peptidase